MSEIPTTKVRTSDMTPAEPLTGNEMLACVQQMKSRRTSPDALLAFVQEHLAAGGMEYWTPGVTQIPGTPMAFDPNNLFDGGSGNGVTLSNNNQTALTTNTNGSGGAIIAPAAISGFTPTSGKKGVYFSLAIPDIDAAPNGTGFYSYTALSSSDGDIPNTPPSFAVSFVIECSKDTNGAITRKLQNIGDNVNASFNEVIGIDLVINDTTEFCAVYDDAASANGSVYFYSSEQPNTILAEVDLPNPHTTLDTFLAYLSSDIDATIGLSVINSPSVEHAGVTNASGGGTAFDPTSYPAEGAGRLFEVTGLDAPLTIDGIAVSNGDVVWFDLESNFQGRAIVRDYLTPAQAAAEYLTPAQAAAEYLTPAQAAAEYLTPAQAASEYLTQVQAASTYMPALTKEEVSAHRVISEADHGKILYLKGGGSIEFLTDFTYNLDFYCYVVNATNDDIPNAAGFQWVGYPSYQGVERRTLMKNGMMMLRTFKTTATSGYFASGDLMP